MLICFKGKSEEFVPEAMISRRLTSKTFVEQVCQPTLQRLGVKAQGP